MTPDLTRYPAWNDYLEREADLTGKIAEAQAALRQKFTRNTEAHESWRAERAEAHAEGRPAPPEPLPPEDPTPERDLISALARQRADLDRDRRSALAAIAPDLEAEWQEALPRLAEAVRATPVGVLPARLREVRNWHRTLHAARLAVETADPNAREIDGPSTRMRDGIDLPDLLDLAEGVDLCAARPPVRVSESEPTRMEFEPLDNGGVRLGLEPRQAFGIAPPMRRATGRPGEI
ncbi:MAG: hypothetical protein R2720_07775 [Candidatus Nanopelagicales bacterium]